MPETASFGGQPKTTITCNMILVIRSTICPRKKEITLDASHIKALEVLLFSLGLTLPQLSNTTSLVS